MTGLAQRCALVLLACCLLGSLGGCATGGAAGQSGRAELATSSDQSAAQKRAVFSLYSALMTGLPACR